MSSEIDSPEYGTPTRERRSDVVADQSVDEGSPEKADLNAEAFEDDKLSRQDSIEPSSPDERTGTSGENAFMQQGKINDELFTPMSNLVSVESSSLASDQIVSWAKTLQSPTLPSFSPGIPPNKNLESYHGTGLMLAINRGNQLNKTTRRAIVVLHGLSNLYDHYATALSKAGQALSTPTAALTSASAASGLAEPVPLLALQQSMASWARDKNKVARHVRSAISGLLQNYLPTHSDTLAAVQNQCSQSRSSCAYARGKALSSRKKYVKGVRDAEQLITELEKSKKKAVTEDENETPQASIADVGKKAVKRFEGKLKEALEKAQRYENRYRLRVKWENECADLCQRLELMALETVQLMEEDRLKIFVETVIKVMSAQKQALDAGVISLSRDVDNSDFNDESEENSETTETVGSKKSARKFVKMLTDSKNSFLSEEESTGAMDAETLGLSEEVGKLRDNVRARLARRSQRIGLAKNLSLFFENIIKALTKLGLSIRQMLKKESANSTESLHLAMAACEGAHVMRLWDGLTSFLEAEADGCFAMADSLRNVRAAKLDSVILYGEKGVKVTSEVDDNAWKNLCEAARLQAKAETRYRQSSNDSARARERVASLDGLQQMTEDEKESIYTNGNNKEKLFSGKRMQKGLANLASLIPNASDHASKMLGPEARATVAQKVLKDASEKASKEKQQLAAAVEATSAALTLYKRDSEQMIARYDEEEKEGWLDIKTSIESFAELAQKLLGTLQLESIADVKPIVEKSRIGMVTDINEWGIKAQQELVAICVDSNVADDGGKGFRLQVVLEPSDSLDKYTESTNAATEVEKLDENEEPSDDELDDEDNEENHFDTTEGNEQEDSMAETQSKARFKRSVFPANQNFPARGKRQFKRMKDRASGADHEDFETDLFLTFFWPEPADPRSVPPIVNSFSCSFRDGAQRLPSQYGRVYVSSSRVIFTSWTKKKLNLKWDEVKDIKGTRSFSYHADKALQIAFKRVDAQEDSCMVLDGFHDRQSALHVMEDLREKCMQMVEAQKLQQSKELVADPSGVVPPDAVIQNMHIVISKHLRNVTIQKFHEIVWSEKGKPLYKPWVEREAFDVEMSDWRAEECQGPWCKQTYQFQRDVKFRVKRKTHLYIGPPIANVVQVHRCALDGNDKCTVGMTISFEGIPYSDTFAVEVRWVALREGQNDIKIQCGIAVDFKKKTFLKSKIQSGTIEESTPVHKSFFEVIQKACIEAGGVQPLEEEAAEPEVLPPKKSLFASLLTAVQEKDQYIHIAAVVFASLFLLLWRVLFTTKSDPSANVDLEIVLGRVDALEAKLDKLQDVMQELLDALTSG